MLNVLREGILKGVFTYESDELENSEQIAYLENDSKKCADAFFYDLQTKLDMAFFSWWKMAPTFKTEKE